MRHITFIGSLNSTFASKWRKKLVPDIVKEGRDIARLGVPAGAYPKPKKMFEDFVTLLYTGEKPIPKKTPYLDPKFRDKIDWARAGNDMHNVRKFDKTRIEQKTYREQYLSEKEIKERIKVLKEKAAQRKNPPPIKEEVKVPKSTSTSLPNNPSPKINSKSATPLLKAKKLPLGKLGLGAVGLATIGAVGYGLLRKTRNDKGKKRGKYKV